MWTENSRFCEDVFIRDKTVRVNFLQRLHCMCCQTDRELDTQIDGRWTASNTEQHSATRAERRQTEIVVREMLFVTHCLRVKSYQFQRKPVETF